MNLGTRVACGVSLSEAVPVNGHVFDDPRRRPWCGQRAIIQSAEFPAYQNAVRSVELGWIAQDVVISRAIEILDGAIILADYAPHSHLLTWYS